MCVSQSERIDIEHRVAYLVAQPSFIKLSGNFAGCRRSEAGSQCSRLFVSRSSECVFGKSVKEERDVVRNSRSFLGQQSLAIRSEHLSEQRTCTR